MALNLAEYPTYNRYRSITDRSPLPLMTGADVWAFQKAYNAVGVRTGPDLITDGRAGPKTGAAIWDVQKALNIIKDGKAGGQTQKTLALYLLDKRCAGDLYRVELGHAERESSYWLGNYSEQRPNGSFDAGVTQMNTEHYSVEVAFSPPESIAYLVQETRKAYDSYVDNSKFVGDDHSDRRRWMLATGHWNAPAYANWLAGVKPSAEPGVTAKAALENYMLEAVVYL